jgi:Sec-independent protein translocase protein TatA
VNDANEPRGHVRKKSVRKKRRNPPVFKPEIVARIERQMNDRWPNLGPQLASLLRVSREKIDDLYSSAAQVISEHKEAFEDRLAEKKEQAQAARNSQQHTQPRPIRRAPDDAGQNGAAKNPSATLPSKRTRPSSKRS